MAIQVIVFDFDGTLVESNKLKYDAYFQLFPQDEFFQVIIHQVLANCFEESRYVILDRMLRNMGEIEAGVEDRVAQLARRYNEIVVERTKVCPQRDGAERMLGQLSSHYVLYLSSTTPEDALQEIVRFRQWERYFKGIFGYPRKKTETLREIILTEQVEPQQVLVVGDGESDKSSAQNVGCKFFNVREFSLSDLEVSLQSNSY